MPSFIFLLFSHILFNSLPFQYADLSQRYGDAATNGSHFNSDGTVGMAIRPASRNEIDIGDALDA